MYNICMSFWVWAKVMDVNVLRAAVQFQPDPNLIAGKVRIDHVGSFPTQEDGYEEIFEVCDIGSKRLSKFKRKIVCVKADRRVEGLQ